MFNKLVCKLKICGISGKILAWLSSFIHVRSQCVVLENCFSSVSYVIIGVPQGSVSGPVLFLIFVNDVTSICSGNTMVNLFSDDLKYSVHNIGDSSSDLQQSIDQLVNWSKLWQLEINLNKCHVLPIRAKSNSNTFGRYTLNGSSLSNLTLTSDLVSSLTLN